MARKRSTDNCINIGITGFQNAKYPGLDKSLKSAYACCVKRRGKDTTGGYKQYQDQEPADLWPSKKKLVSLYQKRDVFKFVPNRKLKGFKADESKPHNISCSQADKMSPVLFGHHQCINYGA